MIFKTVSGSGNTVSGRAQLHKESILKATAATRGQVCKVCFHRAIPEIIFLHLVMCAVF
jgi:hypothetical protein